MSETKVRRLSGTGLTAFSQLLDWVSSDPDRAMWYEGSELRQQAESLLYGEQHSEKIEGDILIDPEKRFDGRFEFGRYLFGLFGHQHLEQDTGLLAWLALLYFDQICEQKGTNSKLKILSKYRYIPEVENNRRFYRHLVLTPLLLWQRMEEDAAFLLSNPLHESSDAVEQLVSRQDFISNPNAIAAAKTLYFDEKKKRPRKGAFTNTKEGNAKRLVRDVMPQLSVNYDMYVMSKKQIIELLPQEFESWKHLQAYDSE